MMRVLLLRSLISFDYISELTIVRSRGVNPALYLVTVYIKVPTRSSKRDLGADVDPIEKLKERWALSSCACFKAGRCPSFSLLPPPFDR